MTPGLNVLSPLVPPALIGTSFARHGHIWQMEFLSDDKLAAFAEDHGLRFSSRSIVQLWQLGILRADYIVQSDKTRRVGFRYLGADRDGRLLYADIRRSRSFPDGWSSAASHLLPVDPGMQPYFHGFRYLVLNYLDSVLQFTSLPIHSLQAPRIFHEVLDDHLHRLQGMTSSAEAIADVDRWNDIASLGVLSEPNMYIRIFGTVRRPHYISDTMHRQQLDKHWTELAAVYRSIGLDRVREIREELCWEARMLEPNMDAHTLLCLAGREDRLKVSGRLGGALVVRTLTEMIRRAAEEVFETQLPEEDVHSTRQRASWVKENTYGSSRLLDDNWAAADEFARGFGLRFGPHVRWYVEGDTEYGAICKLRSLLGAHDVAVVNLHGIIRSKGFASQLLAALSADREARVFSFISIDGDRDDNVKVVRIAAQNDRFCGNFFISEPNVECCNFTKDELEDVLWKAALEEGVTPGDYKAYKVAVGSWASDTCDIDGLMRLATKSLNLHGRLHKSKRWGELLMDYAWDHPMHPKGKLRDILTTLRPLHIARITNYHITQRDYRVDPMSGGMVER